MAIRRVSRFFIKVNGISGGEEEEGSKKYGTGDLRVGLFLPKEERFFFLLLG